MMALREPRTVTGWQLVIAVVSTLSLFLTILWAVVAELHYESGLEHTAITQRMDLMQRQIDRMFDRLKTGNLVEQP